MSSAGGPQFAIAAILMNQGPPTIVVVDDDLEITSFLDNFFTMVGFRVVPCANGVDAPTCIAEHQPAVVILDVRMEHTTGVEVLHELQRNPTTQNVPVVFFTGSGEALRQLLPDYAAHNAYLVIKPNVEQLNIVVQRLVQQSTAASQRVL
jgi:two-component system, OmpR family, phosphate regulon response regulator PhoB